MIDTDFMNNVRIHKVEEFDYWEAKRYLHLKDWHMGLIVSFLVEQMNKQYDYTQAWGFFWESLWGKNNEWNEPEKYTCGKLVDLAFLKADIDLVNTRSPGDVTPKDLFRSSQLHEVY